MRWFTGLLFSVAFLIPTPMAPTSASAQQAQSQQNQSPQGLPQGEVAAICPLGSHWVDAGYSHQSNRYRDGHCEKEFPFSRRGPR